MAGEWLRRCLWAEGRGKPKLRAKISTSRVRSSQKTAGRDHMNPFVRLVVLSEGGRRFPAQNLKDIPAECLQVLTWSRAEPAADLTWGEREGWGFPFPIPHSQRDKPRFSGAWTCFHLMAFKPCLSTFGLSGGSPAASGCACSLPVTSCHLLRVGDSPDPALGVAKAPGSHCSSAGAGK